MKPMAWVLVSLGLLAGASVVEAQGLRAGGGSARGGAAPTSLRAAERSAPQASPGYLTGAGVAPARPALAAGRAPQRTPGVRAAPTRRSGTQEHFASHPVAPQFHRGGIPVLVSPPRFVRPPRFFLGVTPFHPHRHWFFKRHRGVVFIDAFPWAAPVVITQVAPGVIAERRFSDEVPGESRPREAGQLAPFDPTPQEVVERMLALAAVKKGDVVYDLGSGDGRILITAAKKYGVRGVGYEIDAGLIKLARENAKRQGVAHLVEFRHEDFLAADLSAATVVTLYLSQDGNLAVRAQLMQQLNRGARVVSYTFDMGEWQPKISESYRDAAGDTHAIYLWEIGEPMLFSDRRGGGEGPLIIDVP